MIKYIYFEKKPFKIFLSRYFINNGTPSCDVIISSGKVHMLDPEGLSKNYIDVEGAELDILQTNLAKLNVRPSTNKIFIKLEHNIVKYYKDMTLEEKEILREGISNRKSGIPGSYTVGIQQVQVSKCTIESGSEVPEPNGSETCIEIAEIKFNDGFIEINQKLKSDVFFGSVFLGTIDFPSEESSEESGYDSSDSSYEPSDESSDESSEQPSVPSEPPYIPSDESSDVSDESIEPPPIPPDPPSDDSLEESSEVPSELPPDIPPEESLEESVDNPLE